MNISVTSRSWRTMWIQAIKQWLVIQFRAKNTDKNSSETFTTPKVQACSYVWNFSDNTLIFDNNVSNILGFSDQELVLLAPKNWHDRVSRRDILRVVKSLKKCARGDSSLIHLAIIAHDKENRPLCVTIHGEADYLSSTIRGSFMVLDPDFIY